MKTSKISKTLPNGKRMAFLTVIVITFCILNYLALPARGFDDGYNHSDRDLAQYIHEEETDALLTVRDWMFDFNSQEKDDIIQPKNIRNPFRVNSLSAMTTLYSPETELRFESWMVDTDAWGQ